MTCCGDMAIRNSTYHERVHLRPLFWGVSGVIERTIRKSDGGFLYALYCDRCAISDHSAAICHRMSV